MNKIEIKHKYIEKIILIVFMFLPILTIPLYLDNDSWFLLNHGKYVLEYGFPHYEPFTIHQNMEFVMQQWLFSVVYWIIYSSFGKIGIIGCIYICAFLIILLIYKLCMHVSQDKFYLSVILTTVLSLPICMWFVVTRPQIITYLIILTELYCLEKYISSSKNKYLIVLPVLSILQINMHASMWMMLFAFLLPYLIEPIVTRIIKSTNGSYKAIPLFVVSIIMFLLGFLNPYGADSVFYIVRSYGDDIINNHVSEMVAPTIRDFHGAIFIIYFVGVALIYILNKSGKNKTRFVLLIAGTTFLALSSLKSMPYFLICLSITLAYNLKNQAHNLKFSVAESRKNMARTISCSCFLLLIIGLAIGVTATEYNPDKDYPKSRDAVSYLVKNEEIEKVNLYTDYFNGGYAEFMGIKTYIDARAEVFLKDNNGKADIFEEYIKLQSGKIHYKDFLNKYKFTHILVSTDDILSIYLEKDSEYKIIYHDNNNKIFIPIKTEVAYE